MHLEYANLAQICALWKAGSAAPQGYARNARYWECVRALQKKGYIGNARRALEHVAPW